MQDLPKHFLLLNIEDYLLKETLDLGEMRDHNNDVRA